MEAFDRVYPAALASRSPFLGRNEIQWRTMWYAVIDSLPRENSFDLEGDTPLGFNWNQIAGIPVTLTPSNTVDRVNNRSMAQESHYRPPQGVLRAHLPESILADHRTHAITLEFPHTSHHLTAHISR